MALSRPVKNRKITARLTERQFKKLEVFANNNDTTYSGALCALLDRVTVEGDASTVKDSCGIEPRRLDQHTRPGEALHELAQVAQHKSK